MPCCATSTKDAATADCVHTCRTAVVHCARKDDLFPTEPFPLGAMEGLVAAMIPIAMSFVYERPHSTHDDGADTDTAAAAAAANSFLPADVLQNAMAHLLNYYPQLSGRLVLLPNGHRQVDRLDSGALFVEATCDFSLAELHAQNCEKKRKSESTKQKASGCFSDVLSMFDLPADSNALFAPYNPALDHVVVDPLFSVQHTRFACGSVALGIRISHALTDAQGFFLVVQHLMELFGKLRAGEATPCLTVRPQWRSYLANFLAEATAAQVAEALAYQPAGFYLEAEKEPTNDGAAAAAAVYPWPPPETVGRELYFSAAQLEALKRAATPPDGKGWVSTFEAVNALLWQKVYQARCAVYKARDARTKKEEERSDGAVSPPTQWPPTDFLTSINLRDRFLSSPAEAAAYMPCGCFAPSVKVDPEVLHDAPLHQLATVVHTMLRAPELEAEAVRQTACWITAQPDRTRIRTHFTPGGFAISAWNKFDFYSATACEGLRPVLVSTPFTCISLMDALGYILPRPPKFSSPPAADGGSADSDQCTDGVVIYLAVDAALWDALSSDDAFGEYLH